MNLFRKSGSVKLILLTIVSVTVLVLTLPFITVVVIAESGISAVSGALIEFDSTSRLVEVRDPDGRVIKRLESSTAWPAAGFVSQEFGSDNKPYQSKHTGIDIAGPIGSPISPFMSGVIIKAGALSVGCGKCIVIDHGNNITSRYSHLSEVTAEIGQTVKPGDVIARRGNTGWSTGPHLHFEVRVYSLPVNPRLFMIGEPPR